MVVDVWVIADDEWPIHCMTIVGAILRSRHQVTKACRSKCGKTLLALRFRRHMAKHLPNGRLRQALSLVSDFRPSVGQKKCWGIDPELVYSYVYLRPAARIGGCLSQSARPA